MSSTRYDKELEQYRSLMEVPSTFEDGFSWTSLVGAVFIAMLMVPGAMYMWLLAGEGVGTAAQWVTVILFIEIARRAHKTLSRPEIFVLFYMAGAVMAQPFSGLLYNQFYAQSQAATGMGITEHLPQWFAPSDPDVLARRSFFDPAWYPAIGLIVFQTLMSRVNAMVLSYGLFRVASDIEKLPFPMAPIGAQGITALAEQQKEESQRQSVKAEDSWRWRVFSIGGVLGLSFGAIYMALPAVSSALLDEPITILPIPFVDFTDKTSGFLPAVATGISLNLGQFVFGMVLPFFAVVGAFLAYVLMAIANPILYRFGLLPSWTHSDDTIRTQFHNFMDFYFSFGIGLSVAVAVVGIWQTWRSMRKRSAVRKKQQELRMEAEVDSGVPEGRGDIKTRWIIVTYLATSTAYILLCGYLINWHTTVMFVLLFFAFLYTPLLSYVTTRLEGMAGQVVQIPYAKEMAFIVSGYSGGVDVWFLPVPIGEYSQETVFYRQAELTGTKFWSIWKTEFLLVPIVLIAAIFFAQFIWSLDPVPGPEYPYADKMWELNAAATSTIYTSTLGRYSAFQEALQPGLIIWGGAIGVGLFAIMGLLQMPIMLIFGLVKGLNQAMLPHIAPTQFLGAMVGRYYFERKMGLRWRQYIPVAAAGFSCGMGLVTVLGVGARFLSKAVIKIPF